MFHVLNLALEDYLAVMKHNAIIHETVTGIIYFFLWRSVLVWPSDFEPRVHKTPIETTLLNVLKQTNTEGIIFYS